jgi:hypothetical protein
MSNFKILVFLRLDNTLFLQLVDKTQENKRVWTELWVEE